MEKRFYFVDKQGNDKGEAHFGVFNNQHTPHIDEIVSIKCTDKQIRKGRVTSIWANYPENKISIILKLISI